ILVVDDEQGTGDLVTTALRQAGYETVLALDSVDALKRIKTDVFDLILLDWFLADGSGLELCKTIRTFDEHTPVFFYTGVAYEAEIAKAIKAGAQGCFVKPVDVTEMVKTIAFELNGHPHSEGR